MTGFRVTFMPPGTMLGAVGTFQCTVCSAVYETNTPTAMAITDYPPVPIRSATPASRTATTFGSPSPTRSSA